MPKKRSLCSRVTSKGLSVLFGAVLGLQALFELGKEAFDVRIAGCREAIEFGAFRAEDDHGWDSTYFVLLKNWFILGAEIFVTIWNIDFYENEVFRCLLEEFVLGEYLLVHADAWWAPVRASELDHDWLLARLGLGQSFVDIGHPSIASEGDSTEGEESE